MHRNILDALVFDVAHSLGLQAAKLLFVALLLAALMVYLRKVAAPSDCHPGLS
jgi:hypothetical protein